MPESGRMGSESRGLGHDSFIPLSWVISVPGVGKEWQGLSLAEVLLGSALSGAVPHLLHLRFGLVLFEAPVCFDTT